MNLDDQDRELSVFEKMTLILMGLVATFLAMGLYFSEDYKGSLSYVFLNTDDGVVPCKQYGDDPTVECDLSYLKENQ